MSNLRKLATAAATKDEQSIRTLQKNLAASHKREQQLLEQLERERGKRTIRFGKPRSGKRRRGFCRVTWGDSHGMRVDKEAFAAFVADLSVIGPAEVICMGDALDCDGFLSTHRAIGYTSLSEYSYAEDVDAANAQFDAVCGATPRARHDYIEGNHENRVRSWCRDNSENDADKRFHEDRYLPTAVLQLEKRGVAFHAMLEQHDGLGKRGTIKRGKCLFVHGDSHAKRAAEVHLMGAAMNTVFAHTHRIEQFVTSTEATGVIGAWNPGCLCERHPMYMHSKPSTWAHGYGLQFIEPDGTFLHVNVPIIDGRSLLAPMLKVMGVTK